MENNDRTQAETFVSVPQLQERGWTTTMVKKLLGEPDASRPNPRYRSASPMRLYTPARVKAVEDTDDFKVAREAGAKRSAAGKARAGKREAALLAAVETMPVTVTVHAAAQVIKDAICAYEIYHGYEADVRDDGTARYRAFIARITVNYIRHRLTEYDRKLGELVERPGAPKARQRFRVRILQEISRVYPQYRDECTRQRKEREQTLSAIPMRRPAFPFA